LSKAADCKDPVERMKLVIAYALTSIYLNIC